MNTKRNTGKWLKTMIRKHGSLEAVKEHMSNTGKAGGATKGKKGFATTDPARVKEITSLGGKAGKRGKAKGE